MFIESLYLIILIITLFASLFLIGVTWSRKTTMVELWFFICLSASALIVASYLFFAVVDDQSMAFFWTQLRLSGFAVIPLPFLIFALIYTGQIERLRLPYLLLGGLVPMITLFNVWVMPSNIWATWSAETSALVTVELSTFAWGFHLHALYTLSMILVSCALIFRYTLSIASKDRWSAWLLIIGVLISLLMTMLPSLGLTRGLPNPTPIGQTLMFVCIAWALFRQGLLSAVPLSYERIIDHMQDAVIVLDTSQNLVLVNDAAHRLFNQFGDSKFNGYTVQDLFTNNVGFNLLAGQADQPYVAEMSIRIQLASRTLNAQFSPIADENGVVRYQLLVMRDITEEERAKQREIELAMERQRTQLLTTFIQTASHEFRTPLTVISSSAYLMARMDDAERRTAKAEQINQYVQRVNKLVDMLTLMTQLESHPEEFHLQTVDLATIVQVVTDANRRACSKGHVMHYEREGEILPMLGDPTYLTKALNQIVDNACQFTPQGGEITATISMVSSNRIQVEICDTGQGIPSESLNQIFETFWRHDTAHTTPGFGLGLSIAQRIVELHKGEIFVESETGQGTCVRLIFRALPVD